MISREEAIEYFVYCLTELKMDTEAIREAYELAIGDMQKQIPKKPYLWGDGYADGVLIYDMWDCPNCEKTYEVDYEEYKHCPNCGQAIDWSDSE